MASIKQSPPAKANSDSLLNERWKLAVLLGVPAALIGGVLAYRYLKTRKAKGDDPETTKVTAQRVAGTNAASTVRSEKPNESTVQSGSGPRKVDSAASLRSDEQDDDDPLKSPVERAVTLKNRGNKFYKAGKFDRAIEYYSKAIALFEPSAAEDSEGSSKTQVSQRGALEAVNYSDKEKEDVAILFQNRAAAFEQLGERAKALTDCDSALRWNKRYAKALLRRSHLLKDADRLYDAFLDATAVCILERFAVQSNVVESDTLLKQVALSNAKRSFAAPDRSCPFPSRAFIRSYLQAFHNDVVVIDAHARRSKLSQMQEEATQPEPNAFERILDSLNAEEYETTDRLCTEFLRENAGEPTATSDSENDAEIAALQSQLTVAKVQLLKATFTLLRGAARPSIAELQIVTDLLAAADDRAIRITERLPAGSHEALVNAHTARLTVTLLRINAALKRAGASLQAGESDEAERAFRDAESALGVAKKVRKTADREIAEARNVLTEQNAAVARFIELATSCVDAHSDLYHQRAEYLLMSDRLPDALADFDRALDVRPRDSVVQSQRAFSAYRMASAQRDYEGIKSAMRSLDKLAKEHPGCAETASLGAQVHYDAARFDEADTLFARAIAIEPDNPSNYVHRGLLALRRIEAEMMLGGAPPPSGELTAVRDAERFFDSALRVDANCQFALEALGSLELQRGNVARAVELFDRAISSARSEQEMTHLFELREAADVHRAVRERYGVSIDPAALLAAAQAQSFEVPPD